MQDAPAIDRSTRKIIEAAREGIWVLDHEGRTQFVNERMATMLRCSRESLRNRDIRELLPPDAQRIETTGHQELHLRRWDGSTFHASISTSTIGGERGRDGGTLVHVTDLGACGEAAQTLQRQSHALGERIKELDCINRLSALLEQSHAPCAELLSRSVELIPGGWQYPQITAARLRLDGVEFQSDGFRETPWRLEQEIHLEGRRVGIVEVCYLEERPLCDEGPFLKEERNLLGLIATKIRHLIEHRQARAQLEQRARQQAAVAELGRQALRGETIGTLRDTAARRTAELVGVEHCSVLELLSEGTHFRLVAGVGWREGRVGVTAIPNEPDRLTGYTLRSHKPIIFEDLLRETRFATPLLLDYGLRSGISAPMAGPEAVWGILCVFSREPRAFSHDDISFVQGMANVLAEAAQRARSDEALRKQRMLQEVAGRSARIGGWLLRTGDDRVLLSDEACAICELPRGTSPTLAEGTNLLAPEYRKRMVRLLTACLQQGKPYDEEAQILTASGRRLWIRTIGEALRDESGCITELRGAFQDITARKEQDDVLRQAQKMEAVGRLAGGIAHDFNNALMVMLGHAELLADALPDAPELRTQAQGILRSGEHAAQLTRRLLAYSRRQALESSVIDLNELIREVTELLERTLGDDVSIELSLQQGLWPIAVDPAQMESSLLNLAINARDAMPEGGELRIETRNSRLENGECVILTVTDTGVGMDAETSARVFDPFFTTKGPGEGTGLGLSALYGFINQSGGHLQLKSEPGKGTRLTLRLPRHAGSVAAQDAAQERAPCGEETILLVEDEPMIRELLATQLGILGYDVIEAAGADEALGKLKMHETITLMLTDVVMPGRMNGRQLVAAARELRPALKVLLTSGYNEATQREAPDGAASAPVLKKPFHKAELAHVLREIIDEGGQASG